MCSSQTLCNHMLMSVDHAYWTVHQGSTPEFEPRLSASELVSGSQAGQGRFKQRTVSPEVLGSEEKQSDTQLWVQEHGGYTLLSKPVAQDSFGLAAATRQQGFASRVTPWIQQNSQAPAAIGSNPFLPGHTSAPGSGPAHPDVLQGSIPGTHSSLWGNAQSAAGSQVGDSCVFSLHRSENSLLDFNALEYMRLMCLPWLFGIKERRKFIAPHTTHNHKIVL